MNDNEMRGMMRASEVIRALERTYSGKQLLAELRECSRQAFELSQHATDQATRDEWYWRWKMYGAASRRINEKERSHVASVANAA